MLHAQSTPIKPPGVLAGALILGCGLLSIAVVVQHPTVAAHSYGESLRRIAAIASMDQAVHGLLIAFSIALAYGFCIFALRQGPFKQTSIAGLLLYLLGTAAVIGAALVDGFFTPAFAAKAGSSPAALAAAASVLRAGAIMIQILTKAGFLAFSAAILVWSAGLLTSDRYGRYGAIAGAFAGIIPIAMILFWQSYLNPTTLAIMLLSQGVWNVTIGTLMIRSRL